MESARDPTKRCSRHLFGEWLQRAHRLARIVPSRLRRADCARFYTSVPQVDHAVIGEAADEPGDVQDAALRRVVGMPDDGLLSRWAL